MCGECYCSTCDALGCNRRAKIKWHPDVLTADQVVWRHVDISGLRVPVDRSFEDREVKSRLNNALRAHKRPDVQCAARASAVHHRRQARARCGGQPAMNVQMKGGRAVDPTYGGHGVGGVRGTKSRIQRMASAKRARCGRVSRSGLFRPTSPPPSSPPMQPPSPSPPSPPPHSPLTMTTGEDDGMEGSAHGEEQPFAGAHAL